MSACVEPSLSIQAAMLWRALSGGAPLENENVAIGPFSGNYWNIANWRRKADA